MASTSLDGAALDGALSASAPRTLREHSAAAADARPSAARLTTRSLGAARDRAYTLQFLKTSLPLWLTDLVALAAALATASATATAWRPIATTPWESWFIALGASCTLVGWFCGLYPAAGVAAETELRLTITVGTLLFSGAGIALATGTGLDSYGAALVGVGFLCFIVFCPLFRRWVRSGLGRTGWWPQPVLIFGGGASGLRVYQRLLESPSCGLRPIGIVDSPQNQWKDDSSDGARYLGPRSETAEIVQRNAVFRAIVPLERGGERKLGKRLGYMASILPHVIVTFDDWTPLSTHTAGETPLAGVPALRIDQRLLVPGYRWAKLALDVVLAAAVSLVVAPLIAVLAAVTYLTDGRPIFFVQERVGVGGKMFPMYKFRTMVRDAERVLSEHLERDPALKAEWNRFHKLTRDPRVTRLGRFLRKTSLDEIPQLWNVLRGEMSFVGPRPYYEVTEVRAAAPVIMRVRPGITGWWQISGRNRTTFDARLVMDSNYVRDWSPWLDLYILFRTIKVVLTGDGAA